MCFDMFTCDEWVWLIVNSSNAVVYVFCWEFPQYICDSEVFAALRCLNRISGSDDCVALGYRRVARCSWEQAAECYTGKYASLPPPP
jgi:hypothetical protein